MELTEAQLALVADTDPAFLELRADVRATINTTEQEMRTTIAEMLVLIVPCLMPGMGGSLPALAIEVPAAFIRSMYVCFKGLSVMLDKDEALQAAIARARKASFN